MDGVDIVYGLSGHCPWSQWTLSMDPRSNTPAGQCPLSPWTFYRRVLWQLRVSIDFNKISLDCCLIVDILT